MKKIDIAAATRFMITHARVLDRGRFAIALGDAAAADRTFRALAAYRNDDGGYGNALEPDLRVMESQPVTALHAFEVFEEVGEVGATSPDATRLCDWLQRTTLPDGGLPFALGLSETEGSAPFWGMADPGESSVHMTAMLAGIAHRVARHDPDVGKHPWLRTASDYTWRAIEAMTEPGHALEYRFVLQFLDAVYELDPRAGDELRRLGAWLPADGRMHVGGGLEDEAMLPLDFAPAPGRPLRALFDPTVVDADLERLASEQCADGGWEVDFASHSPAGALEWRGHATVRAIRTLKANGAKIDSDGQGRVQLAG